MKIRMYYGWMLAAMFYGGSAFSPLYATDALLKEVHAEGRTLMRIYKQDPSVKELGYRDIIVPGKYTAGPSGKYSIIEMPQVMALPNAQGDFLFEQGTPASDAVHTVAVFNSVIYMYLRDIALLTKEFPNSSALSAINKKWGDRKDKKVKIFYKDSPDEENAFFTRYNDEDGKENLELRFFSFDGKKGKRVHTCQSLDIVAHETGHFFLDTLHPEYFDTSSAQTGALHEAFGDITAMFLALTQHDQCEAIVTTTKGDLHKASFFSELGEEFGKGIGSKHGLRYMDEDVHISKVDQEVHDLSKVFTGAIYDIFVDGYDKMSKDIGHLTTAANILFVVGVELRQIFLRAVIEEQSPAPKFSDIAYKMWELSAKINSSIKWQEIIKNQFKSRGIPVKQNSNKLDWIDSKAKCKRVGICGTVHKSFKA